MCVLYIPIEKQLSCHIGYKNKQKNYQKNNLFNKNTKKQLYNMKKEKDDTFSRKLVSNQILENA